jgi:hypothetical protein
MLLLPPLLLVLVLLLCRFCRCQYGVGQGLLKVDTFTAERIYLGPLYLQATGLNHKTESEQHILPWLMSDMVDKHQ